MDYDSFGDAMTRAEMAEWLRVVGRRILLAHWQQTPGECSCGFEYAERGFPGHLADVLAEAVEREA